MSLSHALLGFLNLGPMTGYDLKKRLDESTQAFWHAGLNQIYPTLKSLVNMNLVESEVEVREGKPNRRVYRITEDGQAELLDWLAEPVHEVQPRKNVALLKLFFSGYLQKNQILLHLHTQLDLHQRELRRYRTEVAPLIADVVNTTGREREGVMWELVRQRGEADERVYVEWLQHAIQTVEAMP